MSYFLFSLFFPFLFFLFPLVLDRSIRQVVYSLVLCLRLHLSLLFFLLTRSKNDRTKPQQKTQNGLPKSKAEAALSRLGQRMEALRLQESERAKRYVKMTVNKRK